VCWIRSDLNRRAYRRWIGQNDSGWFFGGSTRFTVADVWLHGRLAGPGGESPARLGWRGVFVAGGWLGRLTALLKGLFLAGYFALGRAVSGGGHRPLACDGAQTCRGRAYAQGRPALPRYGPAGTAVTGLRSFSMQAARRSGSPIRSARDGLAPDVYIERADAEVNANEVLMGRAKGEPCPLVLRDCARPKMGRSCTAHTKVVHGPEREAAGARHGCHGYEVLQRPRLRTSAARSGAPDPVVIRGRFLSTMARRHYKRPRLKDRILMGGRQSADQFPKPGMGTLMEGSGMPSWIYARWRWASIWRTSPCSTRST